MFTKRFNILTFRGIKIGIDLSWFFIAVLLSWTLASGHFPFYYPHLSPATYWLMGISGMLGLFICVILHELGHALVAQHYRLPVTQITLFIFGGIAEIKKEPMSPKVEFLMAIAGPIVSVVIALFMYFLTQLGNQLGWSILIKGVTSYLATINIVIVIFNLIPAFPLDGGRVLRALLWWIKKDFKWATLIATRIGTGFGFFLIFMGIFLLISGSFLGGFWLMILGLFLCRAAFSSRTQFYLREALQGEKVLKFMKRDPICVPPDITIKEFIDRYIYQSHHHLYPVVEEGRLIGYIGLKEVKSLTQEAWEGTSVKTLMVPFSDFQTVSPETTALEALNLMHQIEFPLLFVVKGDQLLGLLTAQDLFKLISIKLELEKSI
jgi:Zn-dependent protease/CBS domain-containing protein